MMSNNSSYAVIDQLKMESLIGRGGMGDIWRATHTRDGAKVAVKILREELISSTQAREWFRREAEIVQQLKSAQVVKVYRYAVTAERVPYMVMELLEGQDLQTYLDQEGPLDVVSAVTIIIEALKALSEAHAIGVVHRDIKPSNLFWLDQPSTNEAHVKILDFGLATQHNHTSHLPKSLIGTYLFMAPEQARREAVTPRSDIYAISATLYTLITGSPPRRPTGADESFSHFDQPAPRLAERAPKLKVPAKLDQLIQRCLAIEPQERPESADVLRRALEQVLQQLKRRKTSEVDELNLSPIRSGESVHLEIGSERNSAHHRSSQSSRPLNISGEFMTADLAFEGSESSSLLDVLQGRLETIARRWTQAITERPERSGVKTHQLQRYIADHLKMLIGLTAGQPTAQYRSQLAPLTQLSFTHPPLALLPAVTSSLLRKVVYNELKALKLPASALKEAMSTLDLQIFRLRQLFIEEVAQSHYEDSNNALYRLFSSGSDTPLLCTLSGVAVNTHPDLRAALVRDDHLGLTGRKLSSILGGFQPSATLFETLKSVDVTPPSKPYHLSNDSASGRAEELVVHLHLIRAHQQNLLVIVDVISERQMTEMLPSLDDLTLGGEFASPQALPWQMTSEVQALKPEELSSDRHAPLADLNGDLADPEPLDSSLAPVIDRPIPSGEQRDDRLWGGPPPTQPLESAPKRESREQLPSPLQHQAQPLTETSTRESSPRDASRAGHALARSFSSDSLQPKASQERPSTHRPSPPPQHHAVRTHRRSAPPYQRSAPPYQRSAPPYQRSAPPYQRSAPPYHPSYQRSAPPHHRSVSPLHAIPPAYEVEDVPAYLPSMERQERPLHDGSAAPPRPRSPDSYGYETGPQDVRELSQDATDEQVSVYTIESDGYDSPTSRTQPRTQSRSEQPMSAQKPREARPVAPDVVQQREMTQQEVSLEVASYQHQGLSQQLVNHQHPRSKSPSAESSLYASHEHPALNTRTSTRRPLVTHPRSTPVPHFTAHSAQIYQPPPPAQTREPVDRDIARVHSSSASPTEKRTWVVQLLIFLVVVLALLLLRDAFTQWMKAQEEIPTQSNGAQTSQTSPRQSQPMSAQSADQAPLETPAKMPIEDQAQKRAPQINEEYVMVKVNVNKATFFLKKQNQVVCRQIPFCAIPAGSELVIRSQGHYDRYIRSDELIVHQGKVWEVNLEAIPGGN